MLESLFNKVAGLCLKETPTLVFSVNIAKFFRTPILKNICELPLLIFDMSSKCAAVTDESLYRNLIPIQAMATSRFITSVEAS